MTTPLFHRHDVAAHDDVLIDIDGYQTQTLVTVMAGRVVRILCRHTTRGDDARS